MNLRQRAFRLFEDAVDMSPGEFAEFVDRSCGQDDDLRFSDWGQTSTELAPAVYLRGLPSQLDLSQMPPDGWPIELAAGRKEP